MLKKILLGVAVVIVALVVFVATRPSQYRVERSTTIAAPTGAVFAELDDLRRWAAWSPWDKLDPSMQKTFAGPANGVGASYAWSGNDQVGKGKMTIIESVPATRVTYRLEFIEPFASTATTGLTLVEVNDGVRVTWSMEGENGFLEKAFGLFMDMETMIGTDFEKGLANLEAVAKEKAQAAAAEAPTPAVPAPGSPTP